MPAVIFHNDLFFIAKKKKKKNNDEIANQATKAMHCLTKKAKSLCLVIDMQINLFDKLDKPILLYGFEIIMIKLRTGNDKLPIEI